MTFSQLLAQAVFAGNALVSHGGATPYNARFGRQPDMLPELLGSSHGPGQDLQRVREVALQNIIESTAISRINRAARGITSPAGEALDYTPGELLEFHRPPRSKDTPAWRGPAKVLRNEP